MPSKKNRTVSSEVYTPEELDTVYEYIRDGIEERDLVRKSLEAVGGASILLHAFVVNASPKYNVTVAVFYASDAADHLTEAFGLYTVMCEDSIGNVSSIIDSVMGVLSKQKAALLITLVGFLEGTISSQVYVPTEDHARSFACALPN